MASVYEREGTQFLWGKWTDADGNVVRESMETTDAKEAHSRADASERVARQHRDESRPAAFGELTVRDFVGTEEHPGEWLRERKRESAFSWKDDLSRLVHHFLPTFGPWPLAKLATDAGERALYEWAKGLKTHTAKRDGKPLAGRSVWNVYSVAKVLLDDAKELHRLKRNPLESFRTDKHLPEKTDKRDGWRETAGFDLEQVLQLATSPRLREHRRVLNTIAFLCGGPRTGELIELRWRDYTPSYKGGLGRIVFSRSWNSASKVAKATKTGAKKLIPVHPFAGRVLEAWHESGWREWIGRDPQPEDLILPRSDGEHFSNSQLLDGFHADLRILGLPTQRQYENRSSFRMLLLGAGAPDFIVDRMTHPSPKQASDWYTRTEQLWPAMCEAVLRLRLPEGTAEAQGAAFREKTGGVYGTRRREFSSLDSAGSSRDVAAPVRTAPALRIVSDGTAPERSAADVPVTLYELIEAEAEALTWARLARLDS
jgi:hypothetical protein